jgi:hypothetical protein
MRILEITELWKLAKVMYVQILANDKFGNFFDNHIYNV